MGKLNSLDHHFIVLLMLQFNKKVRIGDCVPARHHVISQQFPDSKNTATQFFIELTMKYISSIGISTV